MPQFPGGMRGLSKHWTEHFEIPRQYRKHPPEGEGTIRFRVTETGRVTNISIVKSLNPALDASAIKVVQAMPRWIPATQDGQPTFSDMTIPFFVLTATEGSMRVTYEKRDTSAASGGWIMSLWGGPMFCLGDYGQYFNPVRPTLGLEVGYRKNNWMVALGYDVLAISKVKKPFQLSGKAIHIDDRMIPAHVYMPLGYWFESSAKWAFCPMIAPTLNAVNIDRTDSNSEKPYSVATKTYFSISAGLLAEKRVSIWGRYNPVRERARYESSYVGVRLMANLLNLQQDDSTPMGGAAITLAFSIRGLIQARKKG